MLEMMGLTLAVAGGVLAVWVCLPDVLLLLGLTRIRQGIEAGPEAVVPSPANPLSEDLDAQLTALGFAPAGVYWETIPAHKVFREYVYASKTSDCFALVYQLFGNDPPRVSFCTGFAEQAHAFTQNYRGGLTADESTFRAGGLPVPEENHLPEQEVPLRSFPLFRFVFACLGILALASLSLAGIELSWWKWIFLAVPVALVLMPTGRPAVTETQPCRITEPPPEHRDPLPEVLAEHRRRLAHFLSLGYTISPAHTIDDFLQEQQEYHNHPIPWWALRSASLVILPLKVVFLAFGPAILALFLGIAHPLVWTALLVPSLFVLYFRRYGFPLLAALDRATQESH